MTTVARIATKLHLEDRFGKSICQDLEGSGIAGKTMLSPAFASIEQVENGFLLVRYASNGSFAGDTWHPTIQEAKEQAEYEFGTTHIWKEVPVDLNDIIGFVLSCDDW